MEFGLHQAISCPYFDTLKVGYARETAVVVITRFHSSSHENRHISFQICPATNFLINDNRINFRNFGGLIIASWNTLNQKLKVVIVNSKTGHHKFGKKESMMI
jgi:hypothetical protein